MVCLHEVILIACWYTVYSPTTQTSLLPVIRVLPCHCLDLWHEWYLATGCFSLSPDSQVSLCASELPPSQVDLPGNCFSLFLHLHQSYKGKVCTMPIRAGWCLLYSPRFKYKFQNRRNLIFGIFPITSLPTTGIGRL